MDATFVIMLHTKRLFGKNSSMIYQVLPIGQYENTQEDVKIFLHAMLKSHSDILSFA